MRKFLNLMFGMTLLFMALEPGAYSEDGLPPLEKSPAYQRFTRGPRSEMAKLLLLLDRFHNTDYAVIFNGTTYDANTAIQHGRSYLRKNYDDEKADAWLKVHAYYAGPDGKFIYVLYPSGKRRPMAEVLLEELAALNRDPGTRAAN